MAPTSSSIVVSFALNLATRRPSRMTCISSATSITWGIEWLMNTTPSPRSRTRRIRSRTPLVCTTPRAAVGSSSRTIRLAQAAARATATACFWPPDMAPMLPEKLRTVAPSSSKAGKSGKVKIIGFDAEPDEITALQQGTVQGLIAQSPYTIGTNAVDQAYAALTGKPTTAKIGTKFTIITKDNLSSAASQAAIYKTSC